MGVSDGGTNRFDRRLSLSGKFAVASLKATERTIVRVNA